MELVELTSIIPDLILDIRYATSNNITGHKLYDAPSARLQREPAEALTKVAGALRERGLRIVIWDAYRPQEVQQELRSIISDDHYVSPESNHCRGLAVDVTLADSEGKYLDMGTDFDEFSQKAHRDSQEISEGQLKNRIILSKAMQAEGFAPWPYEWWHFDFLA